MSVQYYAGKIKITTNYKTVDHIDPQGCEQSAELLKENRFTGWRRAINVCKYNVFGLEADVYNLKLKRGMRYIVNSWLNIYGVLMDHSETTTPTSIRALSMNVENTVSRWC